MDIIMPQLGETVDTGTLSSWFVKAGQQVKKDDPLFEIETDKVSMEITAQADGTIGDIKVEAGETVGVGVILATLLVEGEEAGAATAEEPSSVQVSPTAEPQASSDAPEMAAAIESTVLASRDPDRRLSPVVRKLVAEHSLDIASINGTGRDGRITKRDVLGHIESGAPAVTTAAPSAPARAEAPVAAGTGETTVIPFNRIRKLTAEHMVRSIATSAHVLQATEVNFGAVDEVRGVVKDSWRSRYGYSLTYLPFIARAVCLALREYPNLNGFVEGESLVVHDDIHLGIAVDLNHEGLIVPVIKNAHARGVGDLAREMREMASKAREGKLAADDLQGATYTLSNSGSFGTLFTASIISQPQVAILSTDGISKKPVVIESEDGDSIEIRPVGVVAQSFDHRAVDGAYSASFLKSLRTILETRDWLGELI
jgi:pyruvate dehydrogenase E2 component (dihydrolipoamide acetyltransferase)